MENPKAPNPLSVIPVGKVSRVVLVYINQMFLHTGISATIRVQILQTDKKTCPDYERGIHILPVIPKEQFRIFVQTSRQERYLCRITSPEIKKKDLYEGLTARLPGDFLIESTNPSPTERLISTRRKLTFKEKKLVLMKLAGFKAKLSEIEIKEQAILKELIRVRVRQRELCKEITSFTRKCGV